MPSKTAVRAGAQRIIDRIGRRGSFLLFLALLDFIYAYGLANPSPRSANNPTTLFLASIMPLTAWALLWAIVGVACLVSAFLVHDGWGFTAAIALKVLWASMFLFGWLVHYVERGYLSTAIWGAFAFTVLLIATWREIKPLLREIAALQDRVNQLEKALGIDTDDEVVS